MVFLKKDRAVTLGARKAPAALERPLGLWFCLPLQLSCNLTQSSAQKHIARISALSLSMAVLKYVRGRRRYHDVMLGQVRKTKMNKCCPYVNVIHIIDCSSVIVNPPLSYATS